MPGADPERSASGVFLRRPFETRRVRAVGQMKLPGIVFVIWRAVRPGGWVDRAARNCICYLESGASGWLGI